MNGRLLLEKKYTDRLSFLHAMEEILAHVDNQDLPVGKIRINMDPGQRKLQLFLRVPKKNEDKSFE